MATSTIPRTIDQHHCGMQNDREECFKGLAKDTDVTQVTQYVKDVNGYLLDKDRYLVDKDGTD